MKQLQAEVTEMKRIVGHIKNSIKGVRNKLTAAEENISECQKIKEQGPEQ